MKTFISDIIPKIQKYSQKLDNLTLLTNQHWTVIDGNTNSKITYVFRPNNQLLISNNGLVEKAKWEYLENNTLLIDKTEGSYLFKHGFFDENILALKLDSTINEYAFLVNENKFDGQFNSIEYVIDFINRNYLEAPPKETKTLEPGMTLKSYQTENGKLEIEVHESDPNYICFGINAFLNGGIAPDGKYKLGFMTYVYIKNGKVTDFPLF